MSCDLETTKLWIGLARDAGSGLVMIFMLYCIYRLVFDGGRE